MDRPPTTKPGAISLGQVGRYRYALIAVLWVVFCLAAFDRASISVLLVDPAFLDEMGLRGDPQRQGLLMTLLLVPYALANVLLSPLADWWGPRRVFAAMAAAWAGAAAVMGTAGSFATMILGRILRGAAEGPLFPVANRYVKYWFPPNERGRANGIWLTGQPLGLAGAVPLLTLIIFAWGWRAAFFLQVALLLALALPVVWFLTADTPAKSPRVGAAERDHIAAGTAAEPTAAGRWQSGLGSLLGNYRYWLAVTFHLATLAVYNGLATWLPQYLHAERGFDLTGMAFFAALPYLGSTGTTLVFGFVSDRYARRAVFCTLGLAGAALGITLAAVAPDPVLSALLIALGFVAWGITMPNYYAIIQRIVPAGIVATGSGIDNGLANLGSSLAPLAFGVLIASTGSYMPGLLLLAGVGLAGALAAFVLAWQRY